MSNPYSGFANNECDITQKDPISILWSLQCEILEARSGTKWIEIASILSRAREYLVYGRLRGESSVHLWYTDGKREDQRM